jgi:hypothetical protein
MSNENPSSRYDPDKLRKMIEDGLTAREISSELGITPYRLREYLVMLQEIDHKVYVITGLFDYSEKEKPEFRKEGIVFHQEVLEKIGFEPGDAFEMRASGNRIVLEMIKRG